METGLSSPRDVANTTERPPIRQAPFIIGGREGVGKQATHETVKCRRQMEYLQRVGVFCNSGPQREVGAARGVVRF